MVYENLRKTFSLLMALQKLTTGVFSEAISLHTAGLPLGRRMTVVRLGIGGTFVHSPLPWSVAIRQELERFEEPFYFLLPSRYHTEFYEEYFRWCPGAFFFGHNSVLNCFEMRPPLFHDLAKIPLGLVQEFAFRLLAGMPSVNEVVAWHRPSRTLLVADALFNLKPAGGRVQRLLMRINGIHDGPAASRLFKLMIRDKEAFGASLTEILSWNFDRIVPGHGDPIDRNAREVMRTAFEKFLY